ncbi:MAG: hypothetical protein WCH04_05540 [Gammaproteobacteria bacterium]
MTRQDIEDLLHILNEIEREELELLTQERRGTRAYRFFCLHLI